MSKDNLKPGDLAIVIKSLDGAAIGKIVTCLQIDGVHSDYGIMWLVRSTSVMVTEYGGVGYEAHCAQDWLRKIPDDPLPEEEDERELEYVRVLTA